MTIQEITANLNAAVKGIKELVGSNPDIESESVYDAVVLADAAVKALDKQVKSFTDKVKDSGKERIDYGVGKAVRVTMVDNVKIDDLDGLKAANPDLVEEYTTLVDEKNLIHDHYNEIKEFLKIGTTLRAYLK